VMNDAALVVIYDLLDEALARDVSYATLRRAKDERLEPVGETKEAVAPVVNLALEVEDLNP